MLLDSNAEVTAEACTVQVNSVDRHALRIKSNGALRAASVCVGGGYDNDNVVTPTPTLDCPPTPDPLAGLEAPAFGGCAAVGNRHVDAVLTLSRPSTAAVSRSTATPRARSSRRARA